MSPSRAWHASPYFWAVSGYYAQGAIPPVFRRRTGTKRRTGTPPDVGGQLAVEVGWKGTVYPQIEVDAFKGRDDIDRIEVVNRDGFVEIWERRADGEWQAR